MSKRIMTPQKLDSTATNWIGGTAARIKRHDVEVQAYSSASTVTGLPTVHTLSLTLQRDDGKEIQVRLCPDDARAVLEAWVPKLAEVTREMRALRELEAVPGEVQG